jgi:hypothetical protein
VHHFGFTVLILRAKWGLNLVEMQIRWDITRCSVRRRTNIMRKVQAILYIRRDYQQLVTGCHIQCWGRWVGIVVLNQRTPTDKTGDDSDSFYDEVKQVQNDVLGTTSKFCEEILMQNCGEKFFKLSTPCILAVSNYFYSNYNMLNTYIYYQLPPTSFGVC